MNVVAGIGKFLYDLLIGDSLALTFSTVLVLCAAVACTETASLPASVVAIGTALAAAATASLTVVLEARKACRSRVDC